MTVQTTALRGDYTGNGVTVAFAVPFYFLENSHVQIEKLDTLTNVTTTLALTTDYTLAGAGVLTGGTATLLVAPLSTDKIAITRNVPYTQQTHYVEGDPFPSQSHEAALDKLTMLAQQLDEESSRSLKVPSSAAGFDGEISAMLPSRLVGTNAAGTGFELVAPSSGSAAELAVDLADDTSAVKGSGKVGNNLDLDYPDNTVGAFLNEVTPISRKIVAGTQMFGPTDQKVFQANTQSFGPYISRKYCTTENLSIFVDPANGDDANPGTQSLPLATVEAACQLIPQNIYHKVRIWLLDGDYTGQTIQLFGYYVTASSKAGLKIIGHVASVDGEAHPVYASDDLDAVTIDGAHVVSGVYGTEELTIAGVKFVDSWVEAYSTYLLLYKCKFDGGYSEPGFDAKICLGGHAAIIYASTCDFQNCAAAVDAEGFLTVMFDTCTISGMVDSPYYPGTYGCPIKANNGGLVFVKGSPTFWTAGVAGKKNVVINGGRIHGQNPYSEGVGGNNYIRREDGAQAESVHIDGGAGTAPGQGTGGGFTAYGKNASGNNGKALIEFGTSVAAVARVQHIPASLTPTVCMDWNANGDTIPYGYVHQKVGANVASAATIAPTGQVFHVTGTTAVATIHLPFTGFKGTIVLIPDAAFTTTTAGNIGIASTAVVGKALHMTFDGTKWYPSY